MSFVYIASPYTSQDERIRFDRYLEAERYAAHLLRAGIACFSPIAHCHYMPERHAMPESSEFWRDYNVAMMRACRAVHFLLLDNWTASRGMRDELCHCVINGLDHKFILPQYTDYAEVEKPGFFV